MKQLMLSLALVLSMGLPAFATEHFVRPISDCPVNGNGTIYDCASPAGGAGAWSSFSAMLFSGTPGTVGRISPGDTVHVCGKFLSVDKYQTTAMVNTAIAGANSAVTTYDGNCTPYGGTSMATLDGENTVSLGLYTAQRANYTFRNLIVERMSSRGTKFYASAAGEEGTFKGITLEDSIIRDIRGVSSICVDIRGSDVTIQRTVITNCGTDGIYHGGGQRLIATRNDLSRISVDFANGGDGIQMDSDSSGSKVTDNTIDMTAQDSKHCIHANGLTGSGVIDVLGNLCIRLQTQVVGSGINLQSATGYTINIMSNRVIGGLYNYQIFNQDGTVNLIGNFGMTPAEDGIRLGGTGAGTTNVYNNTLSQMVVNGLQQDNPNATTDIKNNIFLGGTTCINRRSGNTEDYNIVHNCTVPLAVAGVAGSLGANSQDIDPLLNKAEDYFPLLSSPALRAGIAVTGCVDVLGRSCTTKPDIGSYQRTLETRRRLF